MNARKLPNYNGNTIRRYIILRNTHVGKTS